jgi:hypothetical protein
MATRTQIVVDLDNGWTRNSQPIGMVSLSSGLGAFERERLRIERQIETLQALTANCIVFANPVSSLSPLTIPSPPQLLTFGFDPESYWGEQFGILLAQALEQRVSGSGVAIALWISWFDSFAAFQFLHAEIKRTTAARLNRLYSLLRLINKIRSLLLRLANGVLGTIEHHIIY